MKRRDFLSLFGKALPAGAFAAAGAGTYSIALEPSWIETHVLDLPTRGLPRALDGLRVVQLSDIHRSDIVSAAFVREAVDLALSLEPELLLLTGDFITGDARAFDWLATELKDLGAAAPAFGVPGNHDTARYYPWALANLPDGGSRLVSALDHAGIDVLRNEHRRVALRRGAATIELVGLDDFWSPSFDDARAFDGLDATPSTTRLVMSHNPDSFRVLRRHAFDLMLCGHTHGGQVRIPLLGAPIVPVEDRRFIAGLVEAEDRRVYVNRGLGYNRRIRFNVRPEVTLLVLRSA